MSYLPGVISTLLKWGIFGLAVALLPLVFSHIMDPNGDMSLGGFLWEFSVTGELLIVATALAGDGMSDVIGMTKTPLLVRLLLSGGCLIVIVTSCMLVGVLQHAELSESVAERLVNVAQVAFISSVLNCAACKIFNTCLETTESNEQQPPTNQEVPVAAGASGSGSHGNNSGW